MPLGTELESTYCISSMICLGHAYVNKWLLLTKENDQSHTPRGFLKIMICILGAGDQPPVSDSIVAGVVRSILKKKERKKLLPYKFYVYIKMCIFFNVFLFKFGEITILDMAKPFFKFRYHSCQVYTENDFIV